MRVRATFLLTVLIAAVMCFGATMAHIGERASNSARVESTPFGGELGAILASVNDENGVPAEAGSLKAFDQTSFHSHDESGTSIEIEDSGEITFSAAGNDGFQVEFVDASEPLTRTEQDEPLAYGVGERAVLVPQINDRRFRGVFVLGSSEAPTDFTMAVTSEEGIRLDPAPDGGVVFSDESGTPVGGFLAPWAKSSQNVPVPTHFELEGGKVRQIVDVSQLGEGDFPVIADPATYVNYTSSSVINVRDLGEDTMWMRLHTYEPAGENDAGRGYTTVSSVQTALDVPTGFVERSIGIVAGIPARAQVGCSGKGPEPTTLYASAIKKTYQVRTVHTYGVPPQLKRQTKTSGVLTAYKPNGRYVCS